MDYQQYSLNSEQQGRWLSSIDLQDAYSSFSGCIIAIIIIMSIQCCIGF